MASEFIGESYYIGRIMEFGKETKGKPLQVRIGWFYRPKDVMARRNYDSRLLIATMHSDMNPISSIRGLCTVTHQAYIKDLDSYKKQPDHFYYNQLFDRYIHRFYDVLPVESVRNLPPDVAAELARRYQYIVVEAGTASEYTDAHRVCLICKRWCASGEALKCIMCQGFHHMLCINPPMLRKPSKGFAFQCALCTKLAMDSASPSSTSSPLLQKQSSSVNNHTSASSSGQNSPRGSPKQKSVSTLTVVPVSNGTKNSGHPRHASRHDVRFLTPSAPLTPQDQKMSHMWPFRYFGTHADIQDIFDPDDRVYPRASSRVGAKYQAVVAKWDGPGQILATSTLFDDPQNSLLRNRSRKGGRGGRPSNKLKVPEEQSESRSRAHSASLETTVDGPDTPVTPSSPARTGGTVDDTVHLERGGDDTATLQYCKPSHISDEYVTAYMERVKGLPLPLPIHSADLIDGALTALQQSGYDAEKALKEIAMVQKHDFEINDWTPREIDAFEEGIRLYGHELFAIKKKVETRSMKDIVRKRFKSVGRGAVTSPGIEIGSRSKANQESAKDTVLDHETIIVPTADIAGKFACAHCGTRSTSMWRRLPGETDPQRQFPRVYCNDCGNEWIRYVTLPPLADPQKDNKKSKNKDALAKAQQSGKPSPSAIETVTATKRKRAEPKSGSTKKIKEQSSDECPQALKQTTGNNWAHVLCAIWIPEINFVDVDKLSPVESIGRVRPERWRQVCSICKKKAGACVGCGEGCKKVFHVTCAREAGYQIAFEMQPTKNIKGGLMVPMVWCPNHDLSSRKVIQIRDQPDALTDRNALQTYAHYYKQCDTSVSNAMRKSRLLMALNPGIGSASSWQKQGGYGSKGSGNKSLSAPVAQERCMRCSATTSPIWWDVPTSSQARGQHEKPSSDVTSVVKIEHVDNSHASIRPLAAEHEQQSALVCHACFWDAKTAEA
ncbi:putative PHD type zinc finger protein with BAH domain-containing protein [Mortierella sp. GBA30]|nr:putative PHD type zinc finger protein with BAH domain-containing protein [Mortierella sp. GBA30]